MLDKVWRKENPLALLVGMQIGKPIWRTVWRVLKKLKTELPYDPALLLLGIYPKKTLKDKWIKKVRKQQLELDMGQQTGSK